MDSSQGSSKGAKGKDTKNKRKKGNKSSSEEETSTTPNTSLFGYLKIKKEKFSPKEEKPSTSTRPPIKTSIFGFKKSNTHEGTKCKPHIKIEDEKPKFVDPAAAGCSQFYPPLKKLEYSPFSEKQSPKPESKNKHIKKSKKKSSTATNSEWYVANIEPPITSYDSLSRMPYQSPLSDAFAPIAYNEILTYENEGKKKKSEKKHFSPSNSTTTLSKNIFSDQQKPINTQIKVRFSFPAKTPKEYGPSTSSSTPLPPPPPFPEPIDEYEEREVFTKESYGKKKNPKKITKKRMQTSTPLRIRPPFTSSSSSSSPSPPPSSSNRSSFQPLQEPPPPYQGCKHDKFHNLYNSLTGPSKYEGYESVSSSYSSLISEDNEIRSMSPDRLKKNVVNLLADTIYKKVTLDDDDE